MTEHSHVWNDHGEWAECIDCGVLAPARTATKRTDAEADAEFLADAADLLRCMEQAIRQSQVKRWQVVTVLPSLRMVAHVLGIVEK